MQFTREVKVTAISYRRIVSFFMYMRKSRDRFIIISYCIKHRPRW